MKLARSEFILGGQKSGKSRRAECLAQTWLQQNSTHRAFLVATGQAWDDEMRQRIAKHQQDRAERVPGMLTIEEPLQLAEVLQAHDQPDTLLVIDCMTLWLTNWLMPMQGERVATDVLEHEIMKLTQMISTHNGRVILVSNEIGLGVIPLGSEVRAFVDTLGRLNQTLAAACQRVTLMAAGLPLTLKDVE